MKTTRSTSEAAALLRQKAEELQKKKSAETCLQHSEADTLKIIHELEVHQIELELQNEELVLAKEQAELATEKYTELFDFAPTGYSTLSREGEIIKLNLCGAQMLGKERSQLINSSFGFFVSDDTKPVFNLFFDKVFQSKAKESCDVTLATNGSPPIFAHLTGIVTNNGGQCLVTMLDITGRKRAEAGLARLAAAVEQAHETVLILDADGAIQYMNGTAERLTGRKRQELAGNKIPIEERYSVQFKKVWEIVTAGNTWTGTITETKADGTMYMLELTMAPVYDEKRIITSIVSIGRDVTRERQLENQLRQSEKMEAMGTLAGGIAHDFNNILGGILNFVEIIKDEAPPASQTAYHLEQIAELGNRAANLVRQILAFSRKTGLKRKPMQLSPLIRDVLKLLQATMPTTIEIRQNLLDQGSMILADPTQIHQVLMNLCINASHAMQEKAGVLEIELTRVNVKHEDRTPYRDIEPGNYVLLRISDTGTGIDPAIINRIFEPFFTTREVGKGTGLGLSVAYGIIKGHGGDITVASEQGKGTAFSILLPEVSAPAEIMQKEKDNRCLPGSEHILFVDDETSQTFTVQRVLERYGYSVTTTQSSLNALAMLRAAPDSFDLVIIDQKMLNMTGALLAKEVLKIRPDIPIILSAGYSTTVDDEKIKDSGIKACLIKPYETYELGRIIRKLLDA